MSRHSQRWLAAIVLLAIALPSKAQVPVSSVALKGKYYVYENQFGNPPGPDGNRPRGWLSLFHWGDGANGGNIGWGERFVYSGNAGGALAFPSCVLGWHWGFPAGYPAAPTGLPARIWENHNFNTDWTFTIDDAAAAMCVGYDLWFHTAGDPSAGDSPSHEIVIWLNRSAADGGNPPDAPGQNLGDVNLAGATWHVTKSDTPVNAPPGNPADCPALIYVRDSNVLNCSLNLRDFINDAVYNQKIINNAEFVTGIEAGSLIYTGKALFQSKSFTCDITDYEGAAAAAPAPQTAGAVAGAPPLVQGLSPY